MAFNWFKKNKNKNTRKDAPANDEAPLSESPDGAQPAGLEENDLPAESRESEALNADSPEEPAEIDAAAGDALEEPVESEAVEESGPEEPAGTEAAEGIASEQTVGYFKRLKNRLAKTRKSLGGGIEKIFSGRQKIDDDVLEELEELLITSDIGVQTSTALIERISKAKLADISQLKSALKKEILAILAARPDDSPPPKNTGTPHVVLVVGVNGVGKTTTIGKLAASAGASGKKVLIAAADTFRAAAVEQLGIWADRAQAEFVKHKENADPAAVAFDAVTAAAARGCDLVLIDTAGRLHTKVNLMEELKKIKRTVAKQVEGAPHEILLVLDATTGQNALSQAKLFNEALDITGLALTKLDGTAKGGIVISICSALNIPLQYIGIGEQIQDLRPFDAEQFIDALL
jgi:fused signal recognition particle receptor